MSRYNTSKFLEQVHLDVMLAISRKLFGSNNDRMIRTIGFVVQQINALESSISTLSDEELFAKTAEFKNELQNGKSLDELLVPAFAVVRETSKRLMQMRHFDVQLIGGIVLYRGMIAEMKTGEGKTLVAPLAAYLCSLEGKGVHVVTVNDYLAKRDSEWMGKLYTALGVTVGCITGDMPDQERKAAYECDIVYSTNNELGFDYLRDNMKFSLEEMVQRGFNYAIIDEVDSILIDEARTPLIISGKINEDPEIYKNIDKLVALIDSSDYDLDEKQRSVYLTETGTVKIEELLKSHQLIKEEASLYDADSVIMMHYIDQALKAHKLFSIDRDYIVKDGRVIIIDEFTGRMMDGRRYSDGLHQALEAKEKVAIQSENQTLASTTFQNYFRMYRKLSGMTGTAKTEAEELAGIYGLQVVQIPTNLPVQRKDLDDDIYCTEEEKYGAIIKFIKECHERLQPILVGTVSIEKSESLSKLLTKHSLKHSVLNARYHEQEAQIIAQAGKSGMITIATNMAGRGTDIQLGGNSEMMMKNFSKLSEAKKQEQYKKILEQVAQDREVVVKAGGLCVIGTERHESRRIDNQLRGRSGRQGDPGLSKFFLSLEDDLLRIFGSDKIKGMLQKFGLKKDEAIQHPWISRALEKAQNKVESRNYDIRKSLLKFDDVINEQRRVMFSQRNQILSGQTCDLVNIYDNFNYKVVYETLPKNLYECEEDRFSSLIAEIAKVYNITLDYVKLADCADRSEVVDHLSSLVQEMFARKQCEFSQKSDVLWQQIIARIMIINLDYLWREHLTSLDDLRHGINLRAIGQKDPLNEYKREAFAMFEAMLNKWYELILHRLSHIQMEDERHHVHGVCHSEFAKVSRNEQCPCGSGKKYKHCHGGFA